MDAKQIIEWFDLQPAPGEGGYNAFVYASSISLDVPGFKGKHSICSAIYYFLDKQTFSAMHRVTGDMLYHFYAGDPVEMLLLYPPGSPNKYEICTFSNDLAAGGKPMKVIPGGTWLGSRLITGGKYALMGVSMAPGYDESDYTLGKRDELIREYPEQKELITELTRG